MTNFEKAPLLFLLQTPLHLSRANTSRSMMEAGRPGELHKKRLSRFDRRNLLKRHDLRGSLCHRRQGFKHVGTWSPAMEAGPKGHRLHRALMTNNGCDTF